MGDLPLIYKPIEPSTWAYLSSLLMFGLFFKFNRLLSIRNIDLFLLLLLSPGLLLIHYGAKNRFIAESNLPDQMHAGYTLPLEPPPSDKNGQDNDSNLRAQEDTAEEVIDANGNIIPPGLKFDKSRLEQQKYWIGVERGGYIWLFISGLALLTRCLIDPSLIRRPLLEPNMNKGGLVFLGIAIMAFLFISIWNSDAKTEDFYGITLGASSRDQTNEETDTLRQYGPGYSLLRLIPVIPTVISEQTIEKEGGDIESAPKTNQTIAKLMVIFCQIMIVGTIVGIGHYHFGHVQMGLGAAALYLVLPYTAMMTGRITHLLPGALMVWAILVYRRPMLSGIFVGLAAGFAYFPLFALPVWFSFYWKRGVKRFTCSLLVTLAALALILFFSSTGWGSFVGELRKMFGFWTPITDGLAGIWRLGWDPWYRVPILAGVFVMCLGFTYWPTEKDFGTLISCTGVTLIAVQFWHGLGGGLYMAWYLPLFLLMIFRPNLQDKTAETMVPEFDRNMLPGFLKR